MCLSAPMEAAESHRFSCNTLGNSSCMLGYCCQSSCVSLSSILAYSFIFTDGCITLLPSMPRPSTHKKQTQTDIWQCPIQCIHYHFKHCSLCLQESIYCSIMALFRLIFPNASTKTRHVEFLSVFLSSKRCSWYVYRNRIVHTVPTHTPTHFVIHHEQLVAQR